MHDGGRDDRIPSVYLQMSGVTKPNAGDALDDSTLCFTRSSCDWSRGNGSGTQYYVRASFLVFLSYEYV